MATSGEGSNPHDRATSRALAQLQELEPRVARRRLSQARHRATLAGLFSNLRETVYNQSELTASKVQGLECEEKKFPHVEGPWSKLGTGLELPPPPTSEGWGLGGSAITCGQLMCAACLTLLAAGL